MGAHTPGPWRVAPPSVGRFKVCAVEGTKVVGEASNYCVDAEANARLIAAAPELLAALQALERYSDGIVCYASTMDEHEPNRIVADARAVIAKATGAAQ